LAPSVEGNTTSAYPPVHAISNKRKQMLRRARGVLFLKMLEGV